MLEPSQIRNPWLCIIIVSALSSATLLGLIGCFLLALYGKPTSEALVSMVGTCIGSLASFLVHPPANSVGIQQGARNPP